MHRIPHPNTARGQLGYTKTNPAFCLDFYSKEKRIGRVMIRPLNFVSPFVKACRIGEHNTGIDTSEINGDYGY